jgi:hypothetical protein
MDKDLGLWVVCIAMIVVGLALAFVPDNWEQKLPPCPISYPLCGWLMTVFAIMTLLLESASKT